MKTTSMPIRTISALAIVVGGLVSPAAAQSTTLFDFDAGAGVAYGPDYEGAATSSVRPRFTASVNEIALGKLKVQSDGGLSFGPSLRLLSARKAADHAILTGIADVDRTLELGLRVGYEVNNLTVFGTARRGFGGHTGITGEIGMDYALSIGDRTKFTIGPRASWANQSYMDSYFSVPGGATLAPFAASAGAKSVGLELSVEHQLNDTWSVEGLVRYDRMTGSPANSPVVTSGDANQVTVGLTLIRRFNWRF